MVAMRPGVVEADLRGFPLLGLEFFLCIFEVLVPAEIVEVAVMSNIHAAAGSGKFFASRQPLLAVRLIG